MEAILPNGGRSVTAAPGYSDFRDDEVYSAGVLQHGGSSQMTLFSIPKGQAIPSLKGSTITTTAQPHQQLYSDLTTNLNKAGELGNGIGDIAVRKIHLTVEQAGYTQSSGVPLAFGATAKQLFEINSKCFFKLTVGQKDQIKGPLYRFGSGGGVYGNPGVATTATTTTVISTIASNGVPGPGGRVLKMPINVARSDTLEAQIGVAANASLTFQDSASADGQPTLVWVNLVSNVRADVR